MSKRNEPRETTVAYSTYEPKMEASIEFTEIVALGMAMVATPAVVYGQTTMTPDECTAMMTKADANSDGNLAADEAAPFAKAISGSDNEGLMTGEEFMDFCQQGLFSEIKME